MRKRKTKRSRVYNPLVYKTPFYIAGLIFLLTGIMFIGGQFIRLVSPQQAAFANPYLTQNQFIDIDEKLRAKGLEVESKSLSSNKTVLKTQLEDGPVVIFSSTYDVDWQISSLHSIIYKLTIDNKQPVQVDFRFGKPVVKF